MENVIMNSRENFHEAFLARHYPSFVDEEFIYRVFKEILYNVTQKVNVEFGEIPNPNMILNYIMEEYLYVFETLEEDYREKLVQDSNFQRNFVRSISDKVIFNEFLYYRARPMISKYHPSITSIKFYLNFILQQFTVLVPQDNYAHLMIDVLRKIFLSCSGITTLLVEGFETEAFSTWRTLHETECIAKILYTYPYLDKTYLRHIEYNRAFRDQISDKEVQQKIIDEIKNLMHQHDLKSKDMKKYIEYGWVYAIENVEKLFPEIKLNFRNGIERIAGLSQYAKIYEMSSEIAHSSPLLIYSNKQYFFQITLICLYETFLRCEEIFISLLRNWNVVPEGFENMRKDRILELETILKKEQMKFQKL